MATHLLHLGGDGMGAAGTYARDMFPQKLPAKKETFSDSDRSARTRVSRHLNFTRSPQTYLDGFRLRQDEALRQYLAGNDIAVGDRVITHILPMRHRMNFLDVEVLKPVPNAGSLTFGVFDIDDIDGPATATLGAVNVAEGVDPAGMVESAGHTAFDMKPAPPAVHLPTQWNWALGFDVTSVTDPADLLEMAIRVTVNMDPVTQGDI